MTPGWMYAIAFALAGAMSVPVYAETIQITIDKLVYSPSEATAKVGDTIEWINKDVLAHTATANAGDNWNVVIAPMKTGRLVLRKAGTVDYFCQYHPNMKARIVVVP
jgi:plastocyanin